MNKYKVNIDIAKSINVYFNTPLFTGDVGNTVQLHFYSDGAPYSMDGVSISAKRADGQTVFDRGTINENIATYTLANNMHNTLGNLEVQVSLTDANGAYLTSGVLHFVVERGFSENSGIEADDRYPLLNTVIANGNYAKEMGDYAKSTVQNVQTEYTYQCTGQNDNVTICNLVDDFLNTNIGVQTMKLKIEGTASFGTFYGDLGTYEDPYAYFHFNSLNVFDKKLVLDFGNCNLPKITDDVFFNSCISYFKGLNDENLFIENVTLTIDMPSEGSTTYGFYNCSNLFHCNINITTKQDAMGFYRCNNILNCNTTVTSIEVGLGGSIGFDGCKNIVNSKSIASGTGFEVFPYAFYQCDNIVNCEGIAFSDADYSSSYGFLDCKRLVNCTGLGYGGYEGYGFYAWSSTGNIMTMTNCNAPQIAKSGYTQTGGIKVAGTTSGAKYSIVGCTSSFPIVTHSVAGEGYYKAGNIVTGGA